MPIVLAGAKITTEQILGDLGMASPWKGKVAFRDNGVRQGKGTIDIDRVRRGGAILSDLGIWILALVVVAGTLAYVNSGLLVAWDPEAKKGWGSGNVRGLGH